MREPARHLHRSISFSILCLILLVQVPAWAPAWGFAPPRSLADLGREAQSIVQGRVIGTRFARNADKSLIYTHVTLDVSRTLKGNHTLRRAHFRVMGGHIGSLGLRVPESPGFDVGEDVVVLLSPDQEGFLTVHGGRQGKLVIQDGLVRGLGISPERLAGVLTGGLPGGDALAVCSILCDASSTPIFRWPQPAMGKPYIVNPIPMDGCTEGEWLSAVTASAETWNAAFAQFVFDYGGTANLTNRGKQPDGNNVIYVGNASSSLAYTTLWFNFHTGEMLENDTVISVDKNSIHWSCDPLPQAGKYDVQSVITHELGHFLFLDDITDPGCRSLTMYGAGYWNNIGPRSLEAADICGIQALYP